MLPSTTFVAGNPRLVRVIVVLCSRTTDTTDNLFIFFVFVFFLDSLLGTLLGLSSLWGFRPILKLIEGFRMLALSGTYRSAGFWFTCKRARTLDNP
jgi:hypothetical protein